MIRFRTLSALLFALALAFAPGLAQARAGAHFGGSSGFSSYGSMGSRGSRTFSGDNAAPIQRSMTSPGMGSSPFGSSGIGGSGAFGRHPFLAGIAGGLLGSWFAHMLFGGYGGGMGSPLGALLHLAILGWLIWFAFRLFRRVGPAGGLAGGGMGAGLGAVPLGLTGRGGAQAAGPALSQQDEAAFAQVLTGIQAAWSRGDLEAMRRLVTPEMLSYFAEELAGNTSRGVENRVEQVHPLDLEVRETWSEGGFDYVTAAMTWSALDYTLRLGERPGDADLVVEGDPQTAHEVSEVWTLVRAPGGHWLLSAVQQLH